MAITFVITFEKLFWPNNAFGKHSFALATVLNNFWGDKGHENFGISERGVYFININISHSHFIITLFSFAEQE